MNPKVEKNTQVPPQNDALRSPMKEAEAGKGQEPAGCTEGSMLTGRRDMEFGNTRTQRCELRRSAARRRPHEARCHVRTVATR